MRKHAFARMFFGKNILAAFWAFFVLVAVSSAQEDVGKCRYAIAVSEATVQQSDWNQVVQVLLEKHAERFPKIFTFKENIAEILEPLQSEFPQYLCLVVRPEEATAEFVQNVHQLGRSLDDDPYPDLFWGILTGYNAENASRIAAQSEPLTIRKVAAGTLQAIDLNMCEEAVLYSERTKNHYVQKNKGESPVEMQGPDDTTESLVNVLNEYQPDLWITSGHASERDWMIGYSYENGFFRHENGKLFGRSIAEKRFDVSSPNPKIYMAAGNCLIGHVDSPDCMATSYMNSAGVCQMFGYIVPSWFGFAGWGVLEYMIDQPGRFTFTEAFFANQTALNWKLQLVREKYPDVDLSDRAALMRLPENNAVKQEIYGLTFDRDVVAFYGDPAWEARMSEAPLPWEQGLEIKPAKETSKKSLVLTVRFNRIEQPLEGERPIVQWLPFRIKDATLLEGAEFHPVIADNFLLIPFPKNPREQESIKIVLEAREID